MNDPLPEIPDETRGYFMTHEIAVALHAHRMARLDDFHARAVAGELLLTDIPEGDRWAVRFRGALAADRPTCILSVDPRPELATRVAWPAGHGDPFAGRPDDVLTDADTLVRFVAPPAGELPGWDPRERDRLLGLDADPEWTALDEQPLDMSEFMEALGASAPTEGTATFQTDDLSDLDDPFPLDGFLPPVIPEAACPAADANHANDERSATR